MNFPKATVVLDMQYGSTGKGLVSSYLATKDYFDVVINANMPNAGHTAYDQEGNKFVHKVLPSAIFHNPRVLMLGPGSVFSPDRLHEEYERALDHGHLHNTKVLVHAQAVPLTPEMVEAERTGVVTGIASTAQGSGAAMMARISRNKNNPVTALHKYLRAPGGIHVVSHKTYMDLISTAANVLCEGAQGYSLGISQDFYPHVTSRDCTLARLLAEMAMPYRYVERVVGVLRTFPIRVGSTEAGSSGDCYEDQEELTWDQVGVEPEITTVTGRVRRVFSFSHKQIRDAIRECEPTELFVNFMNYLPDAKRSGFVSSVNDLCAVVGGCRVRYLGYGPKATDVVELP